MTILKQYTHISLFWEESQIIRLKSVDVHLELVFGFQYTGPISSCPPQESLWKWRFGAKRHFQKESWGFFAFGSSLNFLLLVPLWIFHSLVSFSLFESHVRPCCPFWPSSLGTRRGRCGCHLSSPLDRRHYCNHWLGVEHLALFGLVHHDLLGLVHLDLLGRV